MSAKKILRKTLPMTLTLLVFLILTVLIPYFRFAFKKPVDSGAMEFIAHRGASQLAPENTLQAFEIATKSAVDMIELDVHLSKDGHVIVIHDYDFKRTAGHEAYVEDLTLDEIRQLTIIGSDQKIPTLDEALKTIAGRKKVLIELKWPKSGIYQNLVDATAQIIIDNNAQSWTIAQSFEVEYLHQITKNYPWLECHQLIFGQATWLPFYYDRVFRFGYFKPVDGVKSINLFYLYLSDNFVEKMHAQNKKVRVFTANDREKAGKIAAFGADGLITDNVSLAD